MRGLVYQVPGPGTAIRSVPQLQVKAPSRKCFTRRCAETRRNAGGDQGVRHLDNPLLPKLFNGSDPVIAGARRRNADLNGDHAERAGSTTLRVEIPGPAQRSSPSTPSKSLMVRRRDLSACAERSGFSVRSPSKIRVLSFSTSSFQGVRVVDPINDSDPLIAESSPPRLRVPPRETLTRWSLNELTPRRPRRGAPASAAPAPT